METIRITQAFFIHEDDGISETVLPFITSFVYKLKHQVITDNMLQYLKILLDGIAIKMKFHSSFNFDQEEDNEALFLDFRKELEKLFKSIVRYASQLVYAFIDAPLRAMLSQDCTTLPMANLEAFLRLFFVMGEGFRPNEANAAYFGSLMEVIMNSSM